MNEKKMVSRNVVVALGIVCILLIAFIAYFSITGISAQNSYNNLQNQNKQLQTWLDGNETLLSQTQANNTNLQNQVTSQNSAISQLTSNLTNLQKIASLMESTVLFDYGINFTSLNLNFTAMWLMLDNIVASQDILTGINFESPPTHIDYAGYFVVNVTSSTSNTTYIEWNYTSNGFSYGNTLAIGTTGLAYFPILPTTSLIITIGNTDTTILDIQRVTMTYYY